MYLQKTVCKCSKVSRAEAMVIFLIIGLRHNFTWEAIVDVLEGLNVVLGHEAVPSTKYKIQKYFPVENEEIAYHIYCSRCRSYLGKKDDDHFNESCSCGIDSNEPTKYFVSLNFASRLKKLLETKSVKKNLEKRFSREKLNDAEGIEDIYDGRLYKKLTHIGQPLHNINNLSYTFNTDGCKSANSSKVTIWPIYLSINELTPDARKDNIMLAGVWVDTEEPDMNLFLEPFINDANALSETGIKWTSTTNQDIKTKALPLICVVDSVARPKILTMKQFNGYFGCTFCKHPTENVEGYRKYPITVTKPQLRTDAETKREMVLAGSTCQGAIDGVKGPSSLMNLKHFNLVRGMIPDPMHSLFLGVVAQYTTILLTSSDTEYYIGSPSKKALINERLQNFLPPKCVTRSPRDIDQYNLWKASEWRSWIIWYALPCLQDLIPKKYITHLALLVSAINILLQESVTISELDKVQNLLTKFAVYMQKYFGKRSMTYNMHLLDHIVKSVKDWGPLWMNNTFDFEDENRILLL